MSRLLHALLVVVSLLVAGAVRAESDSRWMKVLLDGRKVGHLATGREVVDGRVTTTERMVLVIDRTGVAMTLSTEETNVETLDGEPLAFRLVSRLSGLASEIEGTIDAGSVQVVQRSGKSEQRRVLPWPEGAVLSEGARRTSARHGLAPGTRYEVLSWEPFSLAAFNSVVTVVGPERVEIDGVRRELVRVDQLVDLDGTPFRGSEWVDASLEVQRATLPMMGMLFELVACSEACATAPNQPLDVLTDTMVDAPRALSADERAAGLAYVLKITTPDPVALPTTAEQRAVREGDAWLVRVLPGRPGDDGDAPTEADLAATRSLNFDDPAVGALARRAAGEQPPASRDALMQRLEAFVRRHIETKSMRVGYASASETAASREGDCTEHAVLLAALGRSLGVPTRVVNGLVYSPEFGGRRNVFVPHAWVQAHDGRRWRSYDAAQPGFGAGHIALGVGDGEAIGFYAGVAALGNLRIRGIEALEHDSP
jgi:hypothetical protein